MGCSADGRFVSTARAIRQALLWAYDLRPYQLINPPSWVDTGDAFYDIEAVAGRNVTQEECREMVRTLLADRFNLTVTRSRQEIPVLALVVARGGHKLEPASESDDKPGVDIVIHGMPMGAGQGAPKDVKPPRGWNMSQLIDLLTLPANLSTGKPVVDRTGLEGLYKMSMEFSIQPPGAPPTDGSSDYIDAVQRLGLRLEERKEPFEMLRIERLERPSAN